MKKATIVTIWLALAFIVLSFIQTIPYYKILLQNDISGRYDNMLNIIRSGLSALIELAILILGIIALTSTDREARDKTYAIFRFVYVAGTVVNYPFVIYSRINYAKYMYSISWHTLLMVFLDLISIALVILLIVNKPEKQVQKVNLQDYDMVTFTSTGHRFLHYILDSLFLLPLTLSVLQGLFLREGNTVIVQLLFTVSYLFYCFFSEAVFGQTFGKMITGSCVVSDGVKLTTGRVFLRTLSRLIPFDAISFLVGAKWHDRVSSTAVVYIDSWEKAFADFPEATTAKAEAPV